MAQLHHGLGSITGLALGHLADLVLVFLSRWPWPWPLIRFPRQNRRTRTVNVGAIRRRKLSGVDRQSLVFLRTLEMQFVRVTDDSRLEVDGLALEDDLDVLAVSGAGVPGGLGHEGLGGGDHGAHFLAVAFLLDEFEGLRERTVQLFAAAEDAGIFFCGGTHLKEIMKKRWNKTRSWNVAY